VARLLAGVDIKSLDDGLGKRAGGLLGRSGGADAIDSALVCLAVDGDEILTSDRTTYTAWPRPPALTSS
jgi:hypothetical protein